MAVLGEQIQIITMRSDVVSKQVMERIAKRFNTIAYREDSGVEYRISIENDGRTSQDIATIRGYAMGVKDMLLTMLLQ